MTRSPSLRLSGINAAVRSALRRGTAPPTLDDMGQQRGGASSPETSLAVPIETGDFVIIEFFSDNGNNLLSDVNPLRELPPFDPSDLIPLSDTLSTLDIGIVSSKPLTLLLSEFCSLVARHQSLQNAEILTTEAYTEQIGAITHRFVLFEIRRSSGQPIWLRLDRRAGRNALRIVAGIGSVPAHDVAQMSGVKSHLLGAISRRENRQVFTTVPSLGELHHLLQVVVKELKSYSVWPANCWFFCSLLQQHLEGAGKGWFVAGSLPHADLARGIRKRIAEQLRLFYHMPEPFSLTTLLHDLLSARRLGGIPPLSRAHELSVLWDTQSEYASNQGKRVARVLAESLDDVAVQLNAKSKGTIEAGILWKQVALIFSELSRQDMARLGADYVGSLLNHARFLYGVHRTAEARVTVVEALTIQRELFNHDPEAQRNNLIFCLNVYALTLRASDRVLEAHNVEHEAKTFRASSESSSGELSPFVWSLYRFSNSPHILQRGDEGAIAGAETVATQRHLYASDPARYQGDLARALHDHGVALHKARLAEAACRAQEEAVRLRRMLASQDPERHDAELASSLQALASSLRLMGRVEEACISDAEAVSLRKELYAGNPERYRLSWASSMHSYGLSLYAAQRAEESCMIENQVVQILRSLSGTESKKYAPALAASLHNHGLMLHEVRRYPAACAAMADAVNLRRPLCEHDPERYRSDLANSYTQLGRSLLAVGKIDEACAAGKEAVAHRRQVYVNDRDRHRAEYLSALGYYSDALMNARPRRWEETCAVHAKLVEHYSIFHDQDSETYRTDFIHWQKLYAHSLRECSRTEEAEKVERNLQLIIQSSTVSPSPNRAF